MPRITLRSYIARELYACSSSKSARKGIRGNIAEREYGPQIPHDPLLNAQLGILRLWYLPPDSRAPCDLGLIFINRIFRGAYLRGVYALERMVHLPPEIDSIPPHVFLTTSLRSWVSADAMRFTSTDIVPLFVLLLPTRAYIYIYSWVYCLLILLLEIAFLCFVKRALNAHYHLYNYLI